jgi:predicted dithiol-disulfide oxidoreductase (DUF899 family)
MSLQGEIEMNMPPIVSPEEWQAAWEKLLVKEKELTRARDALAAERRRMPRVAVEKEYRFEGPNGSATLLDLFEGRRQLVAYRFFFEPGVWGWPESGCRGCSFVADQVAHLAHLNARDTTLAFVSRAPQPDIERWRARMGWDIPWYTLTDDFDKDFGVDEWHGTNAFFRDGDKIFRTYFVNKRGDEAMGRPGATSTSPRSAARRSGRTRRRATPRLPPTAGGTSTTSTANPPSSRRPCRTPPPRSADRGARPPDGSHRPSCMSRPARIRGGPAAVVRSCCGPGPGSPAPSAVRCP